MAAGCMEVCTLPVYMSKLVMEVVAQDEDLGTKLIVAGKEQWQTYTLGTKRASGL